jgi:carboxypeptidase Q
MTWEALRLMRTLNLRARRTVRLVLWTNEENGVRGGAAYRDRHRDELPRHVALLESDIGAFHPTGFGFTGAAASRQIVQRIASLLAGIGVDQVTSGGSGADIDPSAREANIPELSLDSDTTRYFVIHHTAADTVDKIDPREVARGASAVAAMTYVLADMPMSLR